MVQIRTFFFWVACCWLCVFLPAIGCALFCSPVQIRSAPSRSCCWTQSSRCGTGSPRRPRPSRCASRQSRQAARRGASVWVQGLKHNLADVLLHSLVVRLKRQVAGQVIILVRHLRVAYVGGRGKRPGTLHVGMLTAVSSVQARPGPHDWVWVPNSRGPGVFRVPTALDFLRLLTCTCTVSKIGSIFRTSKVLNGALEVLIVFAEVYCGPHKQIHGYFPEGLVDWVGAFEAQELVPAAYRWLRCANCGSMMGSSDSWCFDATDVSVLVSTTMSVPES